MIPVIMLIRIPHGFELHLAGKPAQRIDVGAPVHSVALAGNDYPGLRPTLAVSEGQRVVLGQPLFRSRAHPSVVFTAPATGRVRTIGRGPRRALLEVVIDVDDATTRVPTSVRCLAPSDRGSAAVAELKRALLSTGLWTGLRARPFGGVANPDMTPRALFINAMDTSPLAADPGIVIGASRVEFESGVALLSLLGPRTYLCMAPDLDVDRTRIGTADVVEFSGPHPAGMTGTHINSLAIAGEQPDLWYIGYADVIAIGTLMLHGVHTVERVIALGGPCAARPRLLRTRLGACLADLLADEIDGCARVVCGSPLSGRRAGAATAHLGRYDSQVTLLREHRRRDYGQGADGDTALNGWPSGLLSIEAFERVWPFDSPPIPLLRALLAQDNETAKLLGCLGLEEEDLALCSYVCPAKYDYGRALRATLDALRSEH